MLILLPPSEGKTEPEGGTPLDLDSLVAPDLHPMRERVARALVRTSGTKPATAAARLGLGATQHDLLRRNVALFEAPTARADEVYTGVLYDHLDVASLDSAARKRLSAGVAVASALFGVVRADDLIPAYRLSATVELPRLGPVAALWRPLLGPVLDELTDGGLLLDLRSGAYVNLHKPAGALAERTVTVRVLNESNGVRKVVSHFNKATKGELVRDLIVHDVRVTDQASLTDALRDLGWSVEETTGRLDVVLTDPAG